LAPTWTACCPGPGINDNGSGSATILAIAEQLTKFKTANKVRFAWWGAEELGLVGSPNFVRFVYDGDNSAFPPGTGGTQPGPPGSGAIEEVFSKYFADQGLASAPTPFNGRSDYGPFITATSPAHPSGIPAGGLFSGAEGIKTAEEAATYGGTAGVAYDPCYHQACDTFDNVSLTGLDQMSDAEAHAIITLADSPRRAAATARAAARATAQPRNYQEEGRLAA
jgi:Zn-dependent M28 family amino/carboxypeptidase